MMNKQTLRLAWPTLAKSETPEMKSSTLAMATGAEYGSRVCTQQRMSLELWKRTSNIFHERVKNIHLDYTSARSVFEDSQVDLDQLFDLQ